MKAEKVTYIVVEMSEEEAFVIICALRKYVEHGLDTEEMRTIATQCREIINMARE